MKKLLFAVLVFLMPLFIGCIEDGPLPSLDEILDAANIVPPDVVPPMVADAAEPDVTLPADAMAPEPDATVPVTPDATPETPDASEPDAAPAPPPDAAPATPDAARPPVDASAPASDAACEPSLVDATPTPIVCHGLRVRFSAEDVSRMHHCTGWMADGSAVLIPPATGIYGADGVCAITCNKGESGETVLPSQCSGVWLPGATADAPRWYTSGCRRLPDHPPTEPDQAGCTWDSRCDLY